MIDFTNCPKRRKTYSGTNGSKISIVYENRLFMLKFPSSPTRKTTMSCINGCISEYIGCKIYESLDIPVQNVILGEYAVKPDKIKIIVACEDFETNGYKLQDFVSLKNRIIDSEQNEYGTELSVILSTIDEQDLVDRDMLLQRFWDMFIVDTLIGNCNRHNGNWGFLYNQATDNVKMAPVYDCGSSLFPQANEEMMEEMLKNKDMMNDRVFNKPTSAIKISDKRINYFDFLSTTNNKDCINSLERILNKINMDYIEKLVENTPMITDIHKNFLIMILAARKNLILDYAFKKTKTTIKIKQ